MSASWFYAYTQVSFVMSLSPTNLENSIISTPNLKILPKSEGFCSPHKRSRRTEVATEALQLFVGCWFPLRTWENAFVKCSDWRTLDLFLMTRCFRDYSAANVLAEWHRTDLCDWEDWSLGLKLLEVGRSEHWNCPKQCVKQGNKVNCIDTLFCRWSSCCCHCTFF